MTLILIALLGVVITGGYFAMNGDGYGFFAGVIAPSLSVLGMIGIGVYLFVAWDYFASEYKAEIINREYQENYTQLEVFYASDVINTVLELDRKRVEVNGDLITGK